jgi:hypothetical protein
VLSRLDVVKEAAQDTLSGFMRLVLDNTAASAAHGCGR